MRSSSWCLSSELKTGFWWNQCERNLLITEKGLTYHLHLPRSSFTGFKWKNLCTSLPLMLILLLSLYMSFQIIWYWVNIVFFSHLVLTTVRPWFMMFFFNHKSVLKFGIKPLTFCTTIQIILSKWCPIATFWKLTRKKLLIVLNELKAYS